MAYSETIHVVSGGCWDYNLFEKKEIKAQSKGHLLLTRWHDGTTFTWARGRQLTRAQRTGLDIRFTYDVSGIRQTKTVTRNNQTTEHTFFTQGGVIVAETRRNPNGTTDRLEFIYDVTGRPLQMILNGVVYNYVTNLQGDVLQIRRASDGTVVATYLYNAWGHIISMSGTRAEINPLRYRGYYFDAALGMYYLQSRFYCPFIGRFINADALWVLGIEQGNLLQYNLFTYCLNNPVNGVDSDGYLKHLLAGVVVGALAGGIIQVVANVAAGERWSYGVGSAMAVGAYTGLLISSGVGIGIAVTHGALASLGGSAARQTYNGIVHGRDPCLRTLGIDTLTGAIPVPAPPGTHHTLRTFGNVGGQASVNMWATAGANWLLAPPASATPLQPQTGQRPTQVNPGPSRQAAARRAAQNFATPPCVGRLFLSRPI